MTTAMTRASTGGGERRTAALGLLLLAPITAEYLYGYDDSTGNVGELLGGLFLFAPLYGGAALIVREATRRAGRGWPTILLLGLAFGVLQAGVVDQSMFNPSYRDIDFWDAWFRSFDVAALGLNPIMALAFTVGHMIWSIAVPIAVVEALVPRSRTTPWLGPLGLTAVVAGFVAAAGGVLWWTLDTQDFTASAGQQAGAVAVAVALVVAAFARPGRVPPPAREPEAPSPVLAGAAVFALLGVHLLANVQPDNGLGSDRLRFLVGGPGFVLDLAALGALGVLLVDWSRRRGWGSVHRLAVAGGALLVNVVTAFASEPIGDVSDTAKYAHNTVGLLAVLVLLTVAYRRDSRLAS